MILFLDEDRAYLPWVTRHRNGFVLDCHRKPTKHHTSLAGLFAVQTPGPFTIPS